MYVIHTIRRKIHKYLKQLPYSDACFPVEGYINLYTLFNFFFEKHINISLRDVKSIFYRYWKEWLRVAARVTVVDMMKYVKAIALVRRMVEKFFYNKIVHANLVVKNTYMNTFLTLMYQGRRVIYQDTAGRWDISRRVRYKPFVGFVLARKLVGLLDWLRRTNRFNIINIDIRGLRIYTRSIYNKLRGYRRYLMKSLRYYNYLFIGQELKRARIIIKIFPKKFKWTNVQKQNYDHIKGQCFYFTSRYYHIGCMIRRTKKPFNGCRMLPVKMKRSNKGKGRKKKKK